MTETVVTTAVSESKINNEAILKIETDVPDMELNEFGEAISKLNIPSLEEMVRHINGCIWDHISHEGIRKMRLIMELKSGYFPDLVPHHSPGKPSPWKGIPTEKLIKAVEELGLKHMEVYHNGIRRMRLIMLLKAAGITPESLK